MIFQEPIASLNPCFTVGFQIGEALKTHLGLDRAARRERSIELLARGRHLRAGAAALRLPASAFRRHEPARHDRHGDRLPAEAADRRRADDRARRDHPGADPRPAAEAAGGDRHGARAHHPLHGRGRGDGASRRRAICRPAGRAAGGARPLRAPASSLHGRAARCAARPRHGQPPAGHSAASCPARATARRLPVQPALRTSPPTSAARWCRRCSRPRSARRSATIRATRGRRRHERRHRSRRPRAPLRDRPRRLPPAGDRAGARRRDVLGRGGEDARGRRRIRLRKIHARAPRHHDRAGERAGTSSSTASTSASADRGELKALRRTVQIVFQNPYGSLNPRQKIGTILEEPLVINTSLGAAERRAKALDMRWRASGSGRSTTGATRTCSPAASGSASRSPAR